MQNDARNADTTTRLDKISKVVRLVVTVNCKMNKKWRQRPERSTGFWTVTEQHEVTSELEIVSKLNQWVF